MNATRGNEGVHFNIDKDNSLKERCQRVYEETHSRADFMNLIHKNYIMEDNNAGI